MKKCAVCGAEVNESAVICPSCGCVCKDDFKLTIVTNKVFFRLRHAVIYLTINDGERIALKDGESYVYQINATDAQKVILRIIWVLGKKESKVKTFDIKRNTNTKVIVDTFMDRIEIIEG